MRLPQIPGATRRGFVLSAKRTGMAMVLPGVAAPSRIRTPPPFLRRAAAWRAAHT